MSVSIYRIYSDKGELQYYGSTTRTLNERFLEHKSGYRIGKKCTSIKLFQEYSINNCYIQLLEEVTEELRYERESYYIKTFECVNTKIPERTREEHIEQNKVKIAEQQTKYRERYKGEQYKVKIAEKNKAYAEQNKEKIAEYRKEYNEKNKVKIAEYKKEYNEKNKVKNAEYREQYKVKNAENQKKYRERKKISSNVVDNAEEEKKSNAEKI
jgi:hypothetical protein